MLDKEYDILCIKKKDEKGIEMWMIRVSPLDPPQVWVQRGNLHETQEEGGLDGQYRHAVTEPQPVVLYTR